MGFGTRKQQMINFILINFLCNAIDESRFIFGKLTSKKTLKIRSMMQTEKKHQRRILPKNLDYHAYKI